MIAYNKTWLRNINLLKKLQHWYAHGLLSTEQYNKAKDEHPNHFYQPNVFIKIGLFIFTWLAISTILGLYALMLTDALDSSAIVPVTAILFAIGSFALLELFIKQNNIYQSGTDEALLYAALLSISIAIANMFSFSFDHQNNSLFFALLMLPFLVLALLRYADRIVALAVSLFFFTICFLLILKLGAIAKLIMPFALMAISIPIYLQSKRLKKQDQYFVYKNCFIVFESVALIVFYLSGNYFVIREASISYFGLEIKSGQDIPLAFFFYLFTAVVPICYIVFGLKKKDKIVLWIGLLLLALSVLTFKYYFSLGHPEITLTVSGLIMIIASYSSIKYLKEPKHGLSFEEDIDEENFLKTNAEALLIAQSFSQGANNEVATAPNEGFGGGQSGGAGAGGDF